MMKNSLVNSLSSCAHYLYWFPCMPYFLHSSQSYLQKQQFTVQHMCYYVTCRFFLIRSLYVHWQCYNFDPQVPNLDAIVVPVGAGGMVCGTCIAAKVLKPDTKIYAAEPLNADDCARSFVAKERIPQTSKYK